MGITNRLSHGKREETDMWGSEGGAYASGYDLVQKVASVVRGNPRLRAAVGFGIIPTPVSLVLEAQADRFADPTRFAVAVLEIIDDFIVQFAWHRDCDLVFVLHGTSIDTLVQKYGGYTVLHHGTIYTQNRATVTYKMVARDYGDVDE